MHNDIRMTGDKKKPGGHYLLVIDYVTIANLRRAYDLQEWSYFQNTLTKAFRSAVSYLHSILIG